MGITDHLGYRPGVPTMVDDKPAPATPAPGPQPQPLPQHPEPHRLHRTGWLRAAALGANDGLMSTASLLLGVAAADASRTSVLLAGVAGVTAGAMSMAAGEYISVSSQADTERADLALEQRELARAPARELEELTAIYRARGVSDTLARQVAQELMAHDALAAHARDEIGITDALAARPMQAALASAAAFTAGASLPIALAVAAPRSVLEVVMTAGTLAGLTALGGLAARLGGAPIGRGMVRALLWATVALALSAGVGKLFGVAV
jgi:VIT1/CCC1 family predicted Fe2+/Mn2+ transporter